MSSSSSSGEPEVVAVARVKADYIKAEMMGEFKRLDAGQAELTPPVVKTFQKKWEKECHELEDRIFAASISPAAAAYVPALEALLLELKNFIQMYADALNYHFVPEGSAPPAAPSEDEKEREREERRKRMAKFQGAG